MKKGDQISHIDYDWFWTWEEPENTISMRRLVWWERILYWKWPDKSYKKI